MKHLEPWMWAELETLLPSCTSDVAVDIGAHEGEWTVPLSQRYSKVWSFEAQKELAEQLKKIVPGNVEVVSQALSSWFEVRSFSHYADTAHFSGEFVADGIGTNGSTGITSLPCMALDTWELSDVGLIKVDVEGMEVDVVKGAEQTIITERPLLVVEVHTVENGIALQESLESWNYKAQLVRHPYYKPDSENAERHYWLIGVPNHD